MKHVTVPVKSAWKSKINWTQAVGVCSILLALYLITASPEKRAATIAVIGIVQGLATWVLKTWFTPTVTSASVE